MTPRFPVGLAFVYYADKQKKQQTIVDIYTTTNSKGAVVAIEYVAVHAFLGQKVTQKFGDTAIARSLSPDVFAAYRDGV